MDSPLEGNGFELSVRDLGFEISVKADRWRILVGADAHNVDDMVRQSPEPAYDLGFFDEFARAAGWTERASLENPELRQPS